jgi:hypothetical protein
VCHLTFLGTVAFAGALSKTTHYFSPTSHFALLRRGRRIKCAHGQLLQSWYSWSSFYFGPFLWSGHICPFTLAPSQEIFITCVIPLFSRTSRKHKEWARRSRRSTWRESEKTIDLERWQDFLGYWELLFIEKIFWTAEQIEAPICWSHFWTADSDTINKV